MLSSWSWSSRRVRASRAPKGSSRSIIGGSMAKARAMPTRCCMPPERRAGRRSAASVRPTCSRWVRVMSARSVLLKEGRAERRPKSMLPRAVNQGRRAWSWKTMPRSGPGPLISSLPALTVPVDGEASPAIILRIVDFPQPEGPRRETNSPSLMVMLVSPMIVVEP
ncbi:hypothetical protein cgR_1351 [Corynebacterium glutamicum R]|uniref:Uncharacterized protein n=1 Tax=Corynebacterium glutamicum (strain R) TaxID=340322 RepID=A0AB72VA79_CORGB|nr:hypothetical protein cgR_1351 [Corynebacterium glutamicum R]